MPLCSFFLDISLKCGSFFSLFNTCSKLGGSPQLVYLFFIPVCVLPGRECVTFRHGTV